MIKKYHLADILTAAEVVLAVVLFVMAIIGAPPEYALWVFVAGELCDAADGPCARRWHYPADGKYRWWRRYNSEIDQISDILLAVACGVYLIWRVDLVIGCALLLGLGSFCLFVQTELYYFDKISHRILPKRMPKWTRDAIILIRRWAYVFLGVGGAIATMLWYTEWPLKLKIALTAAGIIIGIVLSFLKLNRLKEDKTPL